MIKELPLWGNETTSANPPRLLDRLTIACQRRHLSPRTAASYRYWARQHIYFHGKRHPDLLGGADIEAFLNHLASVKRVSASTQSQALNALLFLYQDVLKQDIGQL